MSDNTSGSSDHIAPKMVDGVGVCWWECPQATAHQRPSLQIRCRIAGSMTGGEVCPVWARRTAEERDRLREWAERACGTLAGIVALKMLNLESTYRKSIRSVVDDYPEGGA